MRFTAFLEGDYGGQNPASGVTMDPEGSLYGTTLNGGSGGFGTVFQLAHT